MRTHIRMHIDKKAGDVNEESYISCILDDNSTEIPPVNPNKTPSPTDSNEVNKNNSIVRLINTAKSPERAKSVDSNNAAIDKM